jgi:hypothetical protein
MCICAYVQTKKLRQLTSSSMALNQIANVIDPFNSIERADTITIEQKSFYLESCCKCMGVCCADFQNVYDILTPDRGGVQKYVDPINSKFNAYLSVAY